jgi:hypothetical protein
MTIVPVAPGQPGDKVLRALGHYRVLTRRQLTCLLYRPSSTTFVGEHLTRLTRAGYLRMERVPLPIAAGGTPGLWSLREPGHRYLRQAGLDIPTADPPTSPLHLWHLLAVNDALIALERLCRADRRLALERLRHDLDLRRMGLRVRLPDGTAATVVPDAWADLLVAGAPMGLALELDRGTEDEATWVRKLDRLLGLAAGPYRDRLGADSMTVAILTTDGEQRLAALRRWTAAALDAHGLRDWDDLFWFAAGDPAAATPAELYLAPRWRSPGARLPRSLIPLP